ncbi:unnamed protein product [Amoebophrya sp. A120]|nr:unnamed protein product [Amoebophrya sp. A120]|eukprot:GSA120T00009538001.1
MHLTSGARSSVWCYCFAKTCCGRSCLRNVLRCQSRALRLHIDSVWRHTLCV